MFTILSKGDTLYKKEVTMEILNQEEFDVLSKDEKKSYLRQLVGKLPDDKIKYLYELLKSEMGGGING